MIEFKKAQKEIWDDIYRDNYTVPPIESFIDNIIEIFRELKVKKILDLACGSGRHLIYFLEKGFNMYGIDLSDEAIKIANSSLKKESLKADLKTGSIFKQLPYEDDFFDGIICIRSFNHGTIENIRKGISEIERILRPEGLLFLTVRKRVPNDKRLQFEEIAPRTYVPLEGKEKGVVHYLFNKETMRNEFKNFKCCFLKMVYGPKEWEVYYHFLGKLHNF